MVQATIFVANGKMYVIGMDTEKPVYYPITMHELKEMLKYTEETWHNVLAPSNTETQDLHSLVASVGIAEEEG